MVHTSIGEDAHRVDALLDTGAAWRLREGAEQLRSAGVVGGHVGLHERVVRLRARGGEGAAREVEEVVGVPAASTSLAFASACRALGLRRVAIAATYPDDIAALFQRFLADGGVETVSRGALGIITGVEVGSVGRDGSSITHGPTTRPTPRPSCCPTRRSTRSDFLDDLEAAVGKTVLTANQVTTWEALRLAGALQPQDGLGRLFREAAPVRT